MQEVQNENSATAEMLKLDKLEFDRRIAIEKVATWSADFGVMSFIGN